MANIDFKLDIWKKKLLDLGKRNRLINFRESKRSSLNITSPELEDLFQRLVGDEDTLTFPYPMDKQLDEEDSYEARTEIIGGDLETDHTIKEQQRTLKALRDKAKTAMEEQGVNILYLSFGFLNWSESTDSSLNIVSPLVLVPVSITIASITEPYKLTIHEDEIVVNPTLAHKLENDFRIILPDFDFQNEEITNFLNRVAELVKRSGWKVETRTSLSLLSFLKINMYYDLNNNLQKLKNNGIVKALCGDCSEVTEVPEELNDYDHDTKDRPVNIYQVVDADSSQQDAVALSKRGISFVLQGPPGTGKSQTITNIISEALAGGKKVLFVSEKMAALEVVHRRLTHSGLADFCLILHSHKANKREILKSLGDTLRLDRVSVKEDALYQLEVLKNEREKLNAYCKQLHTTCLPLNRTIYEANGILAKLYYAPDVIFSLENVVQTTQEELRKYNYLLSTLVNTIGKLSEDYATNPWKGCIVEQVSHELRQNIDVRLNKLLSQVSSISADINHAFQKCSLDNYLTINTMKDYEELFEFCGTSAVIPQLWLECSNIKELLSQAKDFDKLKKEHSNIATKLLSDYTNDIFELDSQQISVGVDECLKSLFSKLDNDCYKEERDVFVSMGRLLSLCNDLNADIRALLSFANHISNELQIKEPKSLVEVKKLYEFTFSFTQKILPSESWFEADKSKVRYDLLKQAKENQKVIDSIKADIFSVYEKEVIGVAYSDMLKRFKTEYTSFFKIFKKSYKQDCLEIRGFRTIPVKKILDNEILDLLNKLKTIHEKSKWFEEQNGILKEMLGGLFNNEFTSYEDIENAFTAFEKITDYFDQIIPSNIKQFLLSGENYKMHSKRVSEIAATMNSCNIIDYRSILIDKNIETNDLSDTLQESERIGSLLTVLMVELNKIESVSKGHKDYDFHKNSLVSLMRLQEIERLIKTQEERLKDQYQFLYKGIDTDWEHILSSLLWASKFKDYIRQFNLSAEFQNMTVSGKIAEIASTCVGLLRESSERMSDNIEWFDNLFADEYSIKELNIFALQDKIEGCLGNVAGLEEWIDFTNARKDCETEGLSSFISLVLEQRIDKSLIIDAFNKRFYRLWLDAILPQFPAVHGFRSRNHTETIKSFAKLDKVQMDITKLRIRERLISNLPDVNRITSAVDEVGILRRELGKQKKIMPIRKLFARIPTLLPCLKPCLMMSPLSVSLFLQSESYNFDLVIFDEASQVCTENAVGAIMRAKQVVIAGDSKQLPPTNFFNASISDGDFDTDDEELDDSIVYESVLDEAVTVLPERSLKWHYRSRHEDLIAFSNAKIYRNSLVTFPSHVDKVPDYGVEYIYVENGVYDRAGKRNNIYEAKKVASLVFEQLSEYPKRSIGVITFSEAQQQAVDSAIRKLRIEKPLFEEFFNEDRDEPFFIKNIENVQGDERDTIIFSIGYAKDANGVMYMNFGPLSKDGGYRRLNVAITRAKYNIKLVGSIHPTDIRLENTNAEGVRMLRTYIEFAINGTSVLANELTYDKFVNVESPFEESVYDFLVSKGFSVQPQVGCSGYRIDLAVKHPTLDGRFALGVECDGATYHSSRTARERDRLRQSVLEDIGWRIYRIWSTDWIKDPVTEGVKLVEAVNKAISEYTEDISYINASLDEQSTPEISTENYLFVNDVDEQSNDAIDNNGFGFSTYQEADIWSIPRVDYSITDLRNIIELVVKTEYPIHFELLCKRVAPVYGNQKATVKIRREVEYGLSKMMGNIVRKGDFLYPVNYESIIPRIPKDSGKIRPIIYISPEELRNAMLIIISQSFGITKQSLFQVTAREYLFNRMGANIVAAFDEAFEILIINKEVEVIENRVTVTRAQ
ncbi:hypothetical protein BHU72_00800 [Desulfuribacillus stibiiarsenatis]|uniref:RAP domain-containing protein n=1 Tax=Desulfuribacillus stibiiarsenatis TaxID=1390249 RepID=A0A1E5L9K3_9FIRM|nr:DUF4011 domain-containing protein [Desulfuribacillus stibiiarsenatis]OEH86837.1 hypothetical protein BHU72_00800 [Desulfuribacillus stibiiarsenatis]